MSHLAAPNLTTRFNPEFFIPGGAPSELKPGQTTDLTVRAFERPAQLIGLTLPMGAAFVLSREISKVVGDNDGNITGVVYTPGISTPEQWAETVMPLSYRLPESGWLTDNDLSTMATGSTEGEPGQGFSVLRLFMRGQGRTALFSITNMIGIGRRRPSSANNTITVQPFLGRHSD